jgi:hypothetical protein
VEADAEPLLTIHTTEGNHLMALEVSVNEIESAAVGGPGSDEMKEIIAKMVKTDRTFPREPDEVILVKAFLSFSTHKDAELFRELGITISMRKFAKMTKKLLDAVEIRQIRERRAARTTQQVPA